MFVEWFRQVSSGGVSQPSMPPAPNPTVLAPLDGPMSRGRAHDADAQNTPLALPGPVRAKPRSALICGQISERSKPGHHPLGP